MKEKITLPTVGTMVVIGVTGEVVPAVVLDVDEPLGRVRVFPIGRYIPLTWWISYGSPAGPWSGTPLDDHWCYPALLSRQVEVEYRGGGFGVTQQEGDPGVVNPTPMPKIHICTPCTWEEVDVVGDPVPFAEKRIVEFTESKGLVPFVPLAEKRVLSDDEGWMRGPIDMRLFAGWMGYGGEWESKNRLGSGGIGTPPPDIGQIDTRWWRPWKDGGLRTWDEVERVTSHLLPGADMDIETDRHDHALLKKHVVNVQHLREAAEARMETLSKDLVVAQQELERARGMLRKLEQLADDERKLAMSRMVALNTVWDVLGEHRGEFEYYKDGREVDTVNAIMLDLAKRHGQVRHLITEALQESVDGDALAVARPLLEDLLQHIDEIGVDGPSLDLDDADF